MTNKVNHLAKAVANDSMEAVEPSTSLLWSPECTYVAWLRSINYSHVGIKNQCKVLQHLQRRFPGGGDEWLAASHKERTVAVGATSESLYILYWAWTQRPRVCLPSDYLVRSRSSSWKAETFLALGLITAAELQAARELGLAEKVQWQLITILGKTCAFLGKAFHEWSESDTEKASLVVSAGAKAGVFTLKTLQYKLGRIPKPSRTGPNLGNRLVRRFDRLFPDLPNVISAYQAHLRRSGKGPIDRFLSPIQTLLNHAEGKMRARRSQVKRVIRMTRVLAGGRARVTKRLVVGMGGWRKRDLDRVLTVLRAKNRTKNALERSWRGVREFILWGSKQPEFCQLLPPPSLLPNQQAREAIASLPRTMGSLAFQSKTDAECLMEGVWSIPDDELSEREWVAKRFWQICFATGRRMGDLLPLPATGFVVIKTKDGSLPALVNETPDKAQISRTVFPVFDWPVGLPAVKQLMARAATGDIPAAEGFEGRRYVHLFGVRRYPFRLQRAGAYGFLNKVKRQYGITTESDELVKQATHGARHLMAHLILDETGSIEAVAHALGHKLNGSTSTTFAYLSDTEGRRSPARALFGSFVEKEIAGLGFVEHVLDVMATAESHDEMLSMRKDLLSDMTLEEWLTRHAKSMRRGFCTAPTKCRQYKHCWSCGFHLFPCSPEFVEVAIEDLFREEYNLIATLKRSDLKLLPEADEIALVKQHGIIMDSIEAKLVKGLGMDRQEIWEQVHTKWKGVLPKSV